MAKYKCPYCHGNGINRYWWDTGMISKSGRHPVRWVMAKPSDDVYACDHCGMPKNKPSSPPFDWGSFGKK